MEKYGESLGLVVSKMDLLSAAQAVRRNKGAAGVDGMVVYEVEAHIIKFYPPTKEKVIRRDIQTLTCPKSGNPESKWRNTETGNTSSLGPYARWCERL